MPNILKSKGNQKIEFGQVLEYKKKYFSSKLMQKIYHRG